MNVDYQGIRVPGARPGQRPKYVPGLSKVVPNPKAKLLDQVREVLRVKHYSIHTEDAYVAWIKRFIFFHGKRHPREMGAPEVQAFLSDLAVRLQDRYGTSVSIVTKGKKGTILINYYSSEDLERLIDLLLR